MRTRVLAVLCARKGSSRLKGKHWRKIAGRPVWTYAAEAIVAAENCGWVWVGAISTDDKRMSSECLDNYGLFPVLRPPRLASDTSSIHEALQHAVTEYESDTQGEDRIDAVAFVPANVPTVKAKVLRDCFRELDRNPEATAAMTVAQVTQRPEWMWRLDPGSKYLRREGSGRAYRMQDLPDRYIATGTCAVVRRDVLMACRTGAAYKWLGPRIRMVLDPGAIEIHDREDYERAKMTLGRLVCDRERCP